MTIEQQAIRIWAPWQPGDVVGSHRVDRPICRVGYDNGEKSEAVDHRVFIGRTGDVALRREFVFAHRPIAHILAHARHADCTAPTRPARPPAEDVASAARQLLSPENGTAGKESF